MGLETARCFCKVGQVLKGKEPRWCKCKEGNDATESVAARGWLRRRGGKKR
jgi:hypothetical protein